MKRIVAIVGIVIVGQGLSWAQPFFTPQRAFDRSVYVYKDFQSPFNHYHPTGYMGDAPDIQYDGSWTKNVHEGGTCIRIEFENKASRGQQWAGIYWQNPPYNWGDKLGGFNLTSFNKLTFWARGETGTEVIHSIKIGGIKGAYADTDVAGIGPIHLSADWQKYEIPLQGKNLSYISGGFVVSLNGAQNNAGAVFYLDAIRYEE